ncbi:MAG: cation transporter [Alphaproteobacteria bacterium]
MSAHCRHHAAEPPTGDTAYRRVLWIALIVNAAMFAVELIGGMAAASVALQADAVDFFADAANYGVSLFVLGMSLRARALAAFVKGLAMGAFGLFVAGNAVLHAMAGRLPDATPMGVIGALALAANVGMAVLLFRHRDGDANRQSVWLCTRNDAIGNVAVLVAASGVFATGTGWPDYAVAAVMAGLAIVAGTQVMLRATAELRREKSPSRVAAE